MLLYQMVVRPLEGLLGVDASQFEFTDASVPLNTNVQVAACMAVYLAMVFGLPRVIDPKKRGALLDYLFLGHNVLLSAGSAILLGLILENLVPRIVQHGVMWGLCSRDAFEADSRLQLYFYINYLFKYYELIDTVFMIKKGKSVPFLHYFHHSMTMLLCYVQLHGRTTCSWVPITINLLVHVIMYYYYAITSLPTKERKVIWWKKHLTTMQITQFVIDLAVINGAMFVGLTHKYPLVKAQVVDAILKFTGLNLHGYFEPTWEALGRGTLPNNPLALGGFYYGDRSGCYGDISAGWFGLAVINSYLLLFVKFFIDTYNKKSTATSEQKKKE